MRITELFTAQSIALDEALTDQEQIISRLVELQATHGNITDKGCGMCAQKCPKHIILFPLKDDPNPPKPVVKPAAPAAAPAAKPEAKAEAKPETKAE